MFLRPTPLFLLCTLTLAGCNPATALVERAVERELPGLIGPAEAYTVEIDGLGLNAGEAERVTVVGARVRPEGAPILDRLDLALTGVRYDRDTQRLTAVERATATARVLPADLARFLEAHRNVREATLTLAPPDGAVLRLRPELSGFALPAGVAAELTGRLVAEAGRVRFEVSEVRAGGLNLGRTVARRLSDAINPVLDLTGTDIALRVTAVRVEEGAIRVEAIGDPTRLFTRLPLEEVGENLALSWRIGDPLARRRISAASEGP